MTDRFRVVPAVYVLFRRAEQVLLQRRQGTGYMDGHWAAAAAGHVEAEESVLAAACREAAEELDVTIDPADLVGLSAIHRTAAEHLPVDERVDFFFECQRWAGEPRLLEADKAAELRWFRLDALPSPVVPHELFVLERIREGHVDPIVTFGF